MKDYRWNPYKDERPDPDENKKSNWNYDPRDQNYYLGRINEPGNTNMDQGYYTDGKSDRYYRNDEVNKNRMGPNDYPEHPYINNDFEGHRKRSEAFGPHRGKGPKNYTRSMERIREDASDLLMEDSMVDASKIEVWVKDNELILSGTVETRFEKRRAEQLVENIPGVKNVQNNLRVAGEKATVPHTFG